jgi:hypothetical protein
MPDTPHENLSIEPNGATSRPLTSRQILGRSRCQVCRHQDRWRLELLKAGGASLDSLAKKFNVAPDAIWRHWRGHVSPEAKAGYLCGPAELTSLAEKAALEGDSVLDYLRMCRTALTSQLAAMSEAGDARGVAFVTRALVHTLEAIARVTGEMGDLAKSTVFNISNTNNVAVLQDHPAFARVQAAMLKALGPFPDARSAVVLALRDLDATNAPARPAASAGGHVLELEAAHVAG